MEEIGKSSNLLRSINNYNSPFDVRGEIFYRFVCSVMQTLLNIMVIIMLGEAANDSFKPAWDLIFAFSSTLSIIVQSKIYRSNKKKIESRYEYAKANLVMIAEILCKNYHLEIGQKELAEACVVTSFKDESNNLMSSEKTTKERTFFILDRQEKIRVLREIRTKIKSEDKQIIKENALYYDEDYDLSEAPVRKKLVLK